MGTKIRRPLVLAVPALVACIALGAILATPAGATGTAPARLTANPLWAGIGGTTTTPNCGAFTSVGTTCHFTITEPGNADSPIAWSVIGKSEDGVAATETFSPASGTINPGQTVTIHVNHMPFDPFAMWVVSGNPTISKFNLGPGSVGVLIQVTLD